MANTTSNQLSKIWLLIKLVNLNGEVDVYSVINLHNICCSSTRSEVAVGRTVPFHYKGNILFGKVLFLSENKEYLDEKLDLIDKSQVLDLSIKPTESSSIENIFSVPSTSTSPASFQDAFTSSLNLPSTSQEPQQNLSMTNDAEDFTTTETDFMGLMRKQILGNAIRSAQFETLKSENKDDVYNSPQSLDNDANNIVEIGCSGESFVPVHVSLLLTIYMSVYNI